MKNLLFVSFITISFCAHAQVDTSFVYNTATPYGTLDIRIAKSPTRYYYLQENITISFRESAPGVKTNTFRDMTPWNSSPYTQGNIGHRTRLYLISICVNPYSSVADFYCRLQPFCC